MKEYPKINSIFKRDERGQFTVEYSCPEFEYLKDNQWQFTEKVDGTNIRVQILTGLAKINFGGKTDNAQIPAFLVTKLQELFLERSSLLFEMFPEGACLYGEGYGAKIQKGGGNYNPHGVDFALFDCLVGEWWLKRDALQEIADKLQIRIVPIVGYGTLENAINVTAGGFKSQWRNFNAEGLVIRPLVDLFNRKGERIITKIKTKDFKS